MRLFMEVGNEIFTICMLCADGCAFAGVFDGCLHEGQE